MQYVKEKKTVARLNVRVDPVIKERISKAAHILGQDLTEFTISTLDDKAREVLEKREKFDLSEAEKAAFFEILDGNVPPSTDYALKAAKKYRQMIKKGELRV